MRFQSFSEHSCRIKTTRKPRRHAVECMPPPHAHSGRYLQDKFRFQFRNSLYTYNPVRSNCFRSLASTFTVLLYDYSLISDLEDPFSNGHPRGDYFCQVSYTGLHFRRLSRTLTQLVVNKQFGVNKQTA